MGQVKTGCKGYYIYEDGTCEILDGKQPTLRDCKKCTCPGNKYKKGRN